MAAGQPTLFNGAHAWRGDSQLCSTERMHGVGTANSVQRSACMVAGQPKQQRRTAPTDLLTHHNDELHPGDVQTSCHHLAIRTGTDNNPSVYTSCMTILTVLNA